MYTNVYKCFSYSDIVNIVMRLDIGPVDLITLNCNYQSTD